MAHAHVADPVRGDERQRLGVFGDRDHVLVFERPAVEELPVLPPVLDQLADLVVGVIHLRPVAQPGDRIAGGKELLLRPAPVRREVAHHRHAAAAIAGREQDQREGAIARRRAQADRRIEPVDHLDIGQPHGDGGARDRLGDDDMLRINAGDWRFDLCVHHRPPASFSKDGSDGTMPSHCCCDRHQICRFGAS